MKTVKISIIIPCLNESEQIVTTLRALQSLRQRGHEIILVDGGSHDNSLTLARHYVDHCLISAPGRATQMNQGVQIATGDVFCFIHADTLCHHQLDQFICNALQQSSRMWGRFDIQLSHNAFAYRIISWFINKRSCLTGIATGDQGIFVCRNIFKKINGYTEQPLMEDIDLSNRLNKISRPLCIHTPRLITSSRRWEQQGIARTILLMWWIRLKYFCGVPASTLVKSYSPHASQK